MPRALLVLPVAVLAAGIAGAVLVRWPGDVGTYGFGIGSPLRVGTTLAVGEGRVENHSRYALTIDAVRLHRANGLSLVGAVVSRGNSAVGALYGWPPRSGVRFYPARGYRIPPHGNADLVVGLRADHPGTLRDEGVDVLYHREIAGVTVKLADHVGAWVGVCARRTSRQPRCSPPPAPR